MSLKPAGIALGFGILAAATSVLVAQRPPAQTSAAADAARQGVREQRAQQEREWRETQERVDQANREAEEQWNVTFAATRQQRADYEKKMTDFAKAQPQPPGTQVHTVMSAGDDGLPTRGEVQFRVFDKGLGEVVTHRAEFDANGNTTGLVQTPDGRAYQTAKAHIPDGVTAGASFVTGADGSSQFSQIFWSGPNGVSGTIDLNIDGNAYRGEFFGPGGTRTGGFFDPKLEVHEVPPRALVVPPGVRVVTQPCPTCRAAADAYNAIAGQMTPVRTEMTQLARDNATSKMGPQRQAIEARFDALAARWTALAAQLDAALASLRACQAACSRSTQAAPGNIVAQPAAANSATGTTASCFGDTCGERWAACEITHSCEDASKDCGIPGVCAPKECTGICGRFDECTSGACTSVGQDEDPDDAVQLIMVEVVLTSAGIIDPATRLPDFAQLPHRLWNLLASFTSGGHSMATRVNRARLHGRRDIVLPPALNQSNRGAAAGGGGVRTIITGLGVSAGESLQMQILNEAGKAVHLTGNGIVVQPLKKAAAQAAQKELAKYAGKVLPTPQKLEAYCLEMLKLPPALGTVFRIASPQIQEKFAPMRKVLQTTYRFSAAGLLHPDSDPKQYLTNIKQWALWSKGQGLNDEKAFENSWVDHTKKAAASNGTKWTPQIEQALRGFAPGRWKDIAAILQAAR